MPKQFNNKPNTLYETTCGQEIWYHRACAVVSSILAAPLDNPEDMHVLLVKRGPKVELAPSKYCMPSGYIDWNETGHEAAIREVYEESGVYVPNLIKDDSIFIEYDGISSENPWFINTDPSVEMQNIIIYYGMLFYVKDTFPETSIHNNEVEGEIELVEWLPIVDLKKRDDAFNHTKRIHQFIDFLSKKDNIIIKPNEGEDNGN